MIHLDWGSIIVSVPSHAMSSISLSVLLYFPFFRSRSCWLIGVTCLAIDISCRLKFFYWASGKKPIEKPIVDVQLPCHCFSSVVAGHVKKHNSSSVLQGNFWFLERSSSFLLPSLVHYLICITSLVANHWCFLVL